MVRAQLHEAMSWMRSQYSQMTTATLAVRAEAIGKVVIQIWLTCRATAKGVHETKQQ